MHAPARRGNQILNKSEAPTALYKVALPLELIRTPIEPQEGRAEQRAFHQSAKSSSVPNRARLHPPSAIRFRVKYGHRLGASDVGAGAGVGASQMHKVIYPHVSVPRCLGPRYLLSR